MPTQAPEPLIETGAIRHQLRRRHGDQDFFQGFEGNTTAQVLHQRITAHCFGRGHLVFRRLQFKLEEEIEGKERSYKTNENKKTW
jgi:hypothetical protein